MVTFCGTSFMKDMGMRCYVEFQRYLRLTVGIAPLYYIAALIFAYIKRYAIWLLGDAVLARSMVGSLCQNRHIAD